MQLAKPSVINGDLILVLAAFLYLLDNNTRTIAPPAGWTILQHSNLQLGPGYLSAITLFSKIVDGSEGSNLIFTISNSDQAMAVGVCIAVRGGGVGASAKLEEVSPGNVVRTPAIAGSADCFDIRLALAMYNPGTLTQPGGYSLRQAAYNSYLGCPMSTATAPQASAGTYPQASFALAGISGPQVGFSVIARGPQETTDTATAAINARIEHWDQHLGSGTSHSDTNTAALTVTGSSIDGIEYQDYGNARLVFTPSGVDGITYSDVVTAPLKFTPITTHECKTKYVVTLEVVSLQSKWVNANTFNRYNNAVSDTKFYVGYVGVDPSVQDC